MNREFIFETIDFKKERKKDSKRILFFSLSISIVGVIYSKDWIYFLGISILIFGYFYFKNIFQTKFYITSISYSNNNVDIEYLDNGKLERSIIKTKNLSITKRQGFSRTKLHYLIFSAQELEHDLTQYEVGEWDENKMNELIKFHNSLVY